jgi:hypothetical protein
LFIAIAIFTLPLNEWEKASEQERTDVCERMFRSFKADNPSCLRVRIGTLIIGNELKVLIECVESGTGI